MKKLRIGIDATALPPNHSGAGKYIFQLITNLSEIDFQNDYFIFTNSPKTFSKIQNSNFNFQTINFPNKFQRIWWEQNSLPKLTKELQLDVLHSPHYTFPLKEVSCKKIVTIHDLTFFLFPELHLASKRIFFQKFTELATKKADKILTVSESTKKDLAKIFPKSEAKTLAISLGISKHFRNGTKDFEFLRKKGLTENYLLFVGTIEPRKNVEILLLAYKNLLEQKKVSEKLVLVGQFGWKCEKVKSLLKEPLLFKNVKHFGFVEETDLVKFYQNAKAVVYPSIYEGFGFPPLEALACEVPVLSGENSAIVENVKDCALLLNCEKIPELEKGIVEVLKNVTWKQVAEKSAEKVKQEFFWQKTAEKTLEVYLSVTN